VAENQEAMAGLLESLKSTERVTAQEINLQIAQMMLPCMKPTGNVDLDREYSRAMGQCEGFAALTEVMTEVKVEVQARVSQEAEQERATDLDGVKGANAVLNKLKES
jgi:predicted component of type VI protein secretion system